MDLGGGFWGLITIVGPLLLAAGLIWAILHNRMSKSGRADSEAATHKLYEEEDAAHRGEDENVP